LGQHALQGALEASSTTRHGHRRKDHGYEDWWGHDKSDR
jgi:hypothetical protein